MATTLTISGATLAEYVNAHADELLVKASLGSKTLLYVDLMTNCKYKDIIPVLESNVQFRDGSNCGFSPAGSDVFSEREIETHAVEVDKEWCWKDFEKTAFNYALQWQANRANLPWEERIAESNLGKIQEGLEVMLWSGNTTVGVTGYIADILAESGDTIAASGITSASTAMEIVEAVYKAIPGSALKKGVNMYMSHTFFQKYVMERNAACCNKPAVDAASETLPYEGDSRVTLVPVAGLEGIGAVVAASKDALVYGTDLEDSHAVYRMWYSEDNDTFRFKVLFRAGTALRWPDEIAYYIPA